MDYFIDTLRSLGTSLRNLFRTPTTVEFPKVIRPRAERYRASFALLHEENGDEACIGCLQCERICPSKVIAIKGPVKRDSPVTGKKRGYADDFTLDLSACIFCELCVQVCPADAIVMTREQEVPSFTREGLVLTMPMLYANEKSKHRSWGDGTKLMEMQAIPKPPAAPKVAAAAAPPAVAAATAAPATSALATSTPAVAAQTPAASATPAAATVATTAPPAPASAALIQAPPVAPSLSAAPATAAPATAAAPPAPGGTVR